MVDVLLLNRLHTLADHRRWVLGLAASARFGSITVTLVAAQGSGLASRVEVVAHRRARLPREIGRAYRRLRSANRPRPTDAALLAARLAECQAALLDEFADEVAPVWARVSALAVDGPGLRRCAGGLTAYLGLCDAARLADLSGLNVIDDFPARDIAQDGRGRPLLPIPYWMLLRDAHKYRALLQVGRRIRWTYLPASGSGAASARVATSPIAVKPSGGDAAMPSGALAREIAEQIPSTPRVDEFVLSGANGHTDFASTLASCFPDASIRGIAELGIDPLALRSAGVALLGLLQLDQVPANATATTGARTPRVLGRVTPGSVVNWHRLVRELAARRPNAVALRSAV